MRLPTRSADGWCRWIGVSVAFVAAFFVAGGVPSALAQSRVDRPDLRITKASFNGRDLHVEYTNATGVYDRRRYEVGFQWYDAAGRPVGERHWLPQPEVERGGIAILDTSYRIDLTYRRSGGNYNRRLFDFILQRPNDAEELRVTVDDGDRIPETDETNNIARLKIPLPDLQITGAKFLSPNRLELSYRNANPSPIPIPFRIGFTWAEEGGAYVNATRWINVLEPAAGATEIVVLSRTDASYMTPQGRQAGDRLDWYFERRPGNATRLKITIDDAGTVREQNEQNNLVTARPFLPDLVVRDAKFEGGRLTFTYGNAGEGVMRDSASRVLFQWRDAVGKPVGTPHWYRFAQMDPKQLFPVKAERFDVEYAVTGTNRTATQRIDAYLREQPSDAVRLTITVDDEQRISEADETNNTETVTPALPPKPDLTIETITIDKDGQPHATVWNRGAGAASSVVIAHEYRDRAGTPLGGGSRETAPLGLGADQKIIAAILGTIPDAAATAAITVDPKNAVTETDEQNNAKEAPAPMADLVVVEAKPDANGSLALTYRNAGNRKADPLSIWLHFADAQGTQVGPLYWMDVSPIRAGGTQALINETAFAMSSAGQVELRALFEQPPAGATQIKMLLDGPDRVVEVDEGNNTALLPIPVVPWPDFTITDPRVDADGTIHFTVRNIGTAGVTSLRVRGQWVQVDGSPTFGDRGERIFAMSAVGVGFVSEQVAQSILPDIFPAPDVAVALRLVADPLGRLGELNEENNILEIALPPRVPDLAITDLALTADQATWKLRNVGDPVPPTRALTFVVEIQWLDQTGAPVGPSAGINSDIFFPTPTYVHNRSSGYSGSASSDYILRRPAGAAKLRVTEDSANVIREKDETNNVAEVALPPPPQPDLMFARTALIADAPDPRIDYVLKNAGTADTTGGVLELQWLTADGKPTGPTHAFVTYGLLKPGDRATRGLLMQDSGPKPGQTGRYLLLPPEDAKQIRLTLDPENVIAESDETNNVAVLARPPAIPLSDLTVTAAKFTLDAFALTYQNAGSVRAGLGMPLSTWFEWVDTKGGRVGDFVWHDGETLPPKYRTQIEVESRVSSTSRSGFPLREFLVAPPDGATHLKVSLDGPSMLMESDETNNAVVLPVPVRSKPNLQLIGIDTLPNDLILVRTLNRGKAKVAGFRWELQWEDATGALLGTPVREDGIALAPGFSYNVSVDAKDTGSGSRFDTFFGKPPAGAARVRATVDPENAIPESDETDNTATWAPPLPDLQLIGIDTLPNDLILVRTLNRGKAKVAGFRWELQWEDATGALLGTPVREDGIALAPGFSYNVSVDAKDTGSGSRFDTFFGKPPAGAARVRATVDPENAIPESDETNNRKIFDGWKPPEPPKQPDLAFTNIFLVPPKRERLVIGFENKGKAAAPEFPWRMAWVGKDGKALGEPYHGTVPALKPNWRYGVGSDLNESDPNGKPMPRGAWLHQPKPDGAARLEITIDPGNAITESDEANNRQTFDEWVPPKPVEPERLADLRIAEFAMDPIAPRAGERVWFIVRVENVGSAATGAQTATGIIVDPEKSGTDRKLIGQFTAADIASGKSFTHRWTKENYYGWAAVAGTHTIEVCADRAKVVSEGDETNNCTQKVVTVEAVVDEQGKRPDLSVGAVEVRDGTLRITAKNTGESVSAPTDIWLMWFAGSRPLSSSAVVDLPGLPGRGETTITVPFDGKTEASQILRDPPKDGTRVRIFLDGSRKVAESNEDNNDAMFDRAGLPQPKLEKPEQPMKPDLVVEQVFVLPSKPTANAKTEFAAIIRNIGGAPAGDSVAYVVLDLGNDNDPDQAPDPLEFPALKAGASFAKTWPDAEVLPEGTHAVEVCADVGEEVAEANEKNNCREMTFTVVAPARTSLLLLPIRLVLDVFSTPIRAGTME